MKLFDHNAKCPKCGYKTVSVRWCRLDKSWRVAKDCWPRIDDEHFHRECERCGYGWMEKPLDSANPVVAAG